MPPLFINPETGQCDDEKKALKAISRTLRAYIAIKHHVSSLNHHRDCLATLALYCVRGRPVSIFELSQKFGKNDRTLWNIFLEALSHGNIIEIPEKSSKTLKGLDLPSPLLEYAAAKKGMALSFATDSYWENDFILFNEDDKSLPNIWGQTDLHSITAWLKTFYRENESHFNAIQKNFNVCFCCNNIDSLSFTGNQWELIYDAFDKASKYNFEVFPPLIKRWDSSPLLYIRERNHTSFTIRIFFVKCKDRIYVGDIYHKNTDNTLKEEAAADKSWKAICKYCEP